MKVLLLTDGIFPFQIGGMQKHSLILAKLLASSQIQVHLLHCGGNDYSSEKFKELFTESEFNFITETVVKFPKTDPFPGHYIRENKAYSKNAFLELEDQLNDFDLIYAQGFSGWRFIREKHKRKLTLPIFVNFHGLEMYQTPPSLRVMAEYTLFKNAVKWNLRNADYAYSFGGKIDKILLDLGLKEREILQQSNGIEAHWLVEQPTPNNAVRKFVFIGRAERRKGIEELNKAIQLLIKMETNFEFTFIGPIPENKHIQDDRIHYLGEIRDTDRIKAILAQQDCLVCPSHSEGMPTVILEAMACGLAIIGTNVGAVARQIQGNGLLLDKPDVSALEEAITSVASLEDEFLISLKQKSLDLIEEQFVWAKVVDQKINDFENSLAAIKSNQLS
ncbi:MAG: glycosyltransferase involved in cell wall biosynthesis [Crocinitomix sp.]|jgi:glycosyltransferase involved in cell wall biosynthesis